MSSVLMRQMCLYKPRKHRHVKLGRGRTYPGCRCFYKEDRVSDTSEPHSGFRKWVGTESLGVGIPPPPKL